MESGQDAKAISKVLMMGFLFLFFFFLGLHVRHTDTLVCIQHNISFSFFNGLIGFLNFF